MSWVVVSFPPEDDKCQPADVGDEDGPASDKGDVAERGLTDDEDPMSDVAEGADEATTCRELPQDDRDSFAPMLRRPVELAWQRVISTAGSMNPPEAISTGDAGHHASLWVCM